MIRRMNRCSTCGIPGGVHHPQCPVGQTELSERKIEQRLDHELARSPADRLKVLNEEQCQFLTQHDTWAATLGIPDRPLHPGRYDDNGFCLDCGRALDDHKADGTCRG